MFQQGLKEAFVHPLFTALPTIAKAWEQLKCPSVDE